MQDGGELPAIKNQSGQVHIHFDASHRSQGSLTRTPILSLAHIVQDALAGQLWLRE
jgi:hypothetical protein